MSEARGGASCSSTPMFSSSLTLGFDNLTLIQDKKVVVEDAAGIVSSGRITAVVDCSGSQSDSLLLRALAGEVDCMSGTIMMNGIPVDAPAYRCCCVMIDEEFTTSEDLTVQESIRYAASMRVATRAITEAAILRDLLLEDVVPKAVRDCSPYVRWRVSLAKELQLNPSVVCLDQPLERLRTHEACEFLGLLRRIAAPTTPSFDQDTAVNSFRSSSAGAVCLREGFARCSMGSHDTASVTESRFSSQRPMEVDASRRRERIVLLSMAQPRWSVLSLVDDVILLNGERCVFCGKLQELLATIREEPHYGLSKNPISALYQLASRKETSLLDTFAHSGNHDRVRQSVVDFFFKCASGWETLDNITYSSPGAHVRLFYMFKYALLRVRHNILPGAALFVLVTILTMVLAAVYNSQNGQSGMQNRIGIIFFLVNSTYLYSVLSLDAQRKEYNSFLRHRAYGYYGVFTYLTYSVLYCALERLFWLFSLTFVVFCISNIVKKWEYYVPIIQLVFIIGALSFCSHFVVFFCCTIMWTRRFALFALFAVYTINLLLAGIILNLTTLPGIFQLISNASIIRLAYESSILSQFLHNDFGCKPGKDDMCYTGLEYATFLGFKSSRQWMNVGILIGISGLLIIGSLFAMLWHRPPHARSPGVR